MSASVEIDIVNPPWNEHTAGNPFQKQNEPVEVMYRSGMIEKFRFPKVCIMPDNDIVKWRFMPWIENTRANPFYNQTKPVEVLMKSGNTYSFDCPRCCAMSFDLVTHWRFQ